jgi:MFS family permease
MHPSITRIGRGARPAGPQGRLGRRFGFAAAAFALSICMLGTTLPTSLYGLYRERFGFSELMITVIFATYAAGVIASLVLFGRLSDQIGRRRVLLPGLVLSALSAVCFLTATGLPLLLVGRVLSGLSAGIFTGTATATLIDLAPAGRRGRATLVATVANVGALGSGPLLSGLLSQWAGSPLRLTFWVDLALVVPAAIGIWAMPEPIAGTSHPQLRPRALRIPKEMRSIFIEAAVAAFAGFAVLGLLTAVTPDFLGQEPE